MGGAALTGTQPSGGEREENKGQTDVKHKILEKQRKTYVSIYIWTEGTLKD